MFKKLIGNLIIYYLRAFARLAIYIAKPKIIGITGSVGKSSARNMIESVLKDFVKTKTIYEGNSETGIPMGILGINPGHYGIGDWLKAIILSPFKIFNLVGVEYLIVEMGIDSPYPPKNMDYLLTILKPDISIILNAYPVHSQQFDPLIPNTLNIIERNVLITKIIAEEKSKIITHAKPKIAIYNADDKNIKQLISKEKLANTQYFSFGSSKNCFAQFIDYKVSLKKTTYSFLINDNRSKKLIIEFSSILLPKSFAEVVACAIITGLSVNLKISDIKQSIEKNFMLPKGRSSALPGIKNSVIIDSSYNASKKPMITLLQMANILAHENSRPLVVVFGDMRELGKETESEHIEILNEINQSNIDYLYCIGSETEKYIMPRAVVNKEKKWFNNSVELGQYLATTLPDSSIVLIKGSQNTIFLEEAIKQILKNKNDEKLLCRQSSYWINKKKYLYYGV